jgi:predicted TPR repeat methyltransferase
LTSSLKINGWFCFSISKNSENNNDYILTPSGRFVHSLGYVQRLLKYYGLKTISVDEAILRHEGAHDVDGYIILAQKEIEVVFKE